MKYKELLNQSRASLERDPDYIPVAVNIFSTGAKWMSDQMNKTGVKKIRFNGVVNFGFYGFFKYGICTTLFLIAAILMYRVNIFFTPLSIVVFYFCEVHFLFLFPLLIDNVDKPICMSIKQTYRIGLFKSIVTVFLISCFMMIGLLNIKTPFRNWHIGCLAIIIWYQNEVRSRI